MWGGATSTDPLSDGPCCSCVTTLRGCCRLALRALGMWRAGHSAWPPSRAVVLRSRRALGCRPRADVHRERRPTARRLRGRAVRRCVPPPAIRRSRLPWTVASRSSRARLSSAFASLLDGGSQPSAPWNEGCPRRSPPRPPPPVISAWRKAQRRDSTDAGEPSTPATIRPTFSCWPFICVSPSARQTWLLLLRLQDPSTYNRGTLPVHPQERAGPFGRRRRRSASGRPVVPRQGRDPRVTP